MTISIMADNKSVDVGSFSYQYNTRDTLGFTMKATYGVVNGEPREIFKDPITDNGTKKSAKGLLFVGQNEEGEYYLEDQVNKEREQSEENCLKTVFKDGKLLVDEKFEDIRKRLGTL